MLHSSSVGAIAEDYGMICELAPNTREYCLMKSPQHAPNETVSTPCMIVEYKTPSDDILLTADILVADDVIMHLLFQNYLTIKYISLSDLPSMLFTVVFTAQRVSTADYKVQHAVIEQVRLDECASSGE